MHWGLFYLPAWLPERPEEGAERYRTILSQVSYAEELGFESVWLADSQVRLSMRRFVEQVAPRIPSS